MGQWRSSLSSCPPSQSVVLISPCLQSSARCMQNAQSWSRRFASLEWLLFECIWPRRIGSVGSNTTALCAAQHVTRWTWHDLATQHLARNCKSCFFWNKNEWELSDTNGPVLHQGHMYGTAVIAWRKPYEHRMDCILHPFLHRIRKGGLEVWVSWRIVQPLPSLWPHLPWNVFSVLVFLLSVFGSPSKL